MTQGSRRPETWTASRSSLLGHPAQSIASTRPVDPAGPVDDAYTASPTGSTGPASSARPEGTTNKEGPGSPWGGEY
jgi:hypothetical protein